MKKILLLSTFVLLTSQLALAKALYLTVRRDFSTHESASIEINYAQSKPIYLRVLSPKDQKAFISSQVDLRRAWREPKSVLNPAHFLFSGQNDANMESDWIRYGVDFETRKSLIPLAGGAYQETDKIRFSPGPKKLISTPEGFTLAKEIVIAPEDEDSSKPFDVPGFNFNDDIFESSRLKTKIVNLPMLPAGFYVVQAIQGALEGQVVVVVNDLLAQMQVSSGQTLYRISDRAGAPVVGAQVQARNLQGAWVHQGISNAQGEIEFTGVKDDELITVVNAPQGSAIIDSEYYSTSAVFPDLYLYSDRPMYRKGESVKFRGILRNLVGGKSDTIKGTDTVSVSLQGIKSDELDDLTKVAVSEFGTFSGSLKIPENYDGIARIVAKVEKINHSGEVRVKDYVKPLFFVDIKTEQENLKAGDTLKAKLKAERYAGGAPGIARTKAQLYRSRMSAPQWVDDAGLGETGSTVTYSWDSSSGKSDSMLPILVSEEDNIDFDAQGLATLEMHIPEKITGSENYDYKFILKITVIDTDDNVVNTSKTFYDLASDVKASARFNQIVSTDIATSKLIVRSLSISGKTLPEVTGSVQFFLIDNENRKKEVGRKDILTDKKGQAQITLPESLNSAVGELIVEVTLFDRSKRASKTEASLILAGKRNGEAILDLREPRIISNKFDVTPTDKAQLFILLPKGWGPKRKNSGNLYITIAGQKIHSHRVVKVDGNSLWLNEAVLPEYQTGFYVSISYPSKDQGWIERRSSFRIIDQDKKLTVTALPDRSLVSPGTEQGVLLSVKDSKGNPVRAEVSISVVDKAVFDLQPEIRPPLLDFFYPPTKLNLMTFYSSQFQGYGYGEEIARLFNSNFKLAAAKTESKIMEQKDTAFWNAQVVTDIKGSARVKFRLPGNQTVWKITSIAVDKSGRFGENTNEFKAQSTVSVLLGMPSFIRQGDRTQLRINLSSVQANETVSVNYKLSPEPQSNLVFEAPIDIKKQLSPKQQFSQSIRMSVKPDWKAESGFRTGAGAGLGTGAGSVQGLVGQLNVDKSEQRFRDTLKVYENQVSIPEYLQPMGSKFNVSVNSRETIEGPLLSLTTGLAGVIIPTMEWMVRYPYGCVEQTLNTTLPNLGLSRWLEQSEKRGLKLTAREQSFLKQATDFGQMGLQRLKMFQHTEGGFKWMMEDNTGADQNMSLIVLLSLSLTEEKRESLNDFRKSVEFMKRQSIDARSPQGLLLTFIESQFSHHRSLYLSPGDLTGKLRVAAEYAIKQGSLIERALILLAITQSKSKNSFGEERAKLLQSVTLDVQPLLAGSSDLRSRWSPNQTGWSAFPGHVVSALALASMAIEQEAPSQFANMKMALKASLIKHFNGQHFGSTFDNAMVFFAITHLLDDEVTALVKSEVSQSAKIRINGNLLAASKLQAEHGLGGIRYQLPAAELNKSKSNLIEVDAPQGMTSRLIFMRKVPLANAATISRGWTLSRTYFQLDNRGERQLIEPGKSRLKVGDLVFSEIRFLRNGANNLLHSRYYLLSEDVPAGLTPIQEDHEYRASPYKLPLAGSYRTRQISNEQVRWTFDFTRGWMDKSETLGMVYRVNYPGSFDSGVVRMEDFYDETQTSMSPSIRLDIDSVVSR